MKIFHTSFAQWARLFTQRLLPILMWAVAAIWAQNEWSNKKVLLQFPGQIIAESWEVSGTTTGILKDVRVDRFAEVKAGQILATLDDAQFLADLEVARKELNQLRAQVSSAEAELQASASEIAADWASDLRRFQVDVQRFRVEVLDLDLQGKKISANLRQQKDLAVSCLTRIKVLEEKEALVEKQWSRLDILSKSGQASSAAVDSARAEWLEVVAQKMQVIQEEKIALGQIETLMSTLAALTESGKSNQEQLALAQKRLNDFERTQPGSPALASDPRIQTVMASIDVQTSRIESLAVHYQALQLRAKSPGTVQGILARPGQSILPGEPVLMLAKSSSSQLLGWAPERLHRNKIEALDFTASSTEITNIPISFLRIGPIFEELPQILWKNPSIPEYGQPVLFELPPNTGLTPGEPVQLSTVL